MLTAVFVCSLPPFATAAEPGREETLDAMRRAARFMVEEVSCNGGYVWIYSADLSRRWGEAPARDSQIWVQGGTVDMGQGFLDNWEATGDPCFLEYARRAANALIYGQHPLGGWHYFIDFDRAGLEPWYRDVFSSFKWGMEEYRHYYGNCTFDDDVTAGATRFLMRLYLATLDPAYREPLDRALAFIRMAQYPNGGWPQRYPLRHEFVHDGLPDYTSLYTYNDGVISNNIALLVEAYERLGDERNLEAARRGMDFLIVSQGPEGQAGWADQHGMDLRPAWGRTHEHPGYMPRYTIQAVRALQEAWLFTGDRRYLKPVPAALGWLEQSALEAFPDGSIALAPRYEVGGNRPIWGVRSQRVNGEGYGIWEWTHEQPTGRASRVALAALRSEYEKVAVLSPEQARARHTQRRGSLRYSPGRANPDQVAALIEALDERGAWVEEVRVYMMDLTKPSPPGRKWDNYDAETDDHYPVDRIRGLSTSRFRQHMRVLADYVAMKE
jgi:PelA/Pel-15E family pectate lyase